MGSHEKKRERDDPRAGAAAVTEEIRQRLADRAGVRMEMVERITRAIAAGEYRLDPEAIAERILARHPRGDG